MNHLVVVVPGVGGSVLSRGGVPVWDAGIGDIVGLVTDAERLSLSDAPDLIPTGLIASKRWLPGWTVVHGYEKLLAGLGQRLGGRIDLGDPAEPRMNATVAAFPYDFRRSIVKSAEALQANVKLRLEALGAGRDERRVIVLAHSMGGLVARYWLGPMEGWKCCRALITLGTPHRGAPKALDWLVNGVRVGPVRFDHATEVFRQWRSLFELLPRYQAVWDDTEDRAIYPHELPIDWFSGSAKDAFKVHERIERSWAEMPRTGPEVVAAVGWSHQTLLGARWDGDRLRVAKRTPGWVEAPGWEQDFGDGTVPAISAVPLEMSGARQGLIRVRQRHSPIVDTQQVIDLVAAYEAHAPIDAVRGDETQAGIGLDLEDAYLAGEAIPLSVTLHHCRPTATTQVWATIRTRGVAGKTQVELQPDGAGGYSADDVRAPPAGIHEVSVLATDLEGAGELDVVDSFATVEPN